MEINVGDILEVNIMGNYYTMYIKSKASEKIFNTLLLLNDKSLNNEGMGYELTEKLFSINELNQLNFTPISKYDLETMIKALSKVGIEVNQLRIKLKHSDEQTIKIDPKNSKVNPSYIKKLDSDDFKSKEISNQILLKDLTLLSISGESRKRSDIIFRKKVISIYSSGVIKLNLKEDSRIDFFIDKDWNVFLRVWKDGQLSVKKSKDRTHFSIYNSQIVNIIMDFFKGRVKFEIEDSKSFKDDKEELGVIYPLKVIEVYNSSEENKKQPK